MPVLDGSMIQVQFRRRSAACARVFLADPPQVLLDGLVTDGHLARDGFHRHPGRVELESALFLMAESRPVGGLIGGEDVGQAGEIQSLPAATSLIAARIWPVCSFFRT